jgi:hypothetical protein
MEATAISRLCCSPPPAPHNLRQPAALAAQMATRTQPTNPCDADLNVVTNTKSPFLKNVALGISGIAAGSFLASIPFVLMQFKSSLPYMTTPSRKVVLGLKAVEERLLFQQKQLRQQRSHSSSNFHVVRRFHFTDMGSGDGEAILAAVRRGWVATGIEMNPTLWAISQIRKFLMLSTEERQRATFLCGDMLHQNLSCTNCIMIFGVQPLMADIAQKINKEAEPGTYILSYRFKFPLDKLNANIVIEQEEMRVYQVKQHPN